MPSSSASSISSRAAGISSRFSKQYMWTSGTPLRMASRATSNARRTSSGASGSRAVNSSSADAARRNASRNSASLMPGQRKSIEPMAARLGMEPQRLQQFMADSPWDETELWRVIRREVVPHFEPIEAWIVDETGWLKQGKNSVGVAHQYCGAVGKQANCQVSVELVVSDGFVAAPVGGRLYLPQSWIDDPQRCAKAGVPPDVGFATKNEIALTLIEQALADQVVPAPVLGDAAYGNSFAFRAHLRELN